MTSKRKKLVIETLLDEGIQTIGDLDRWREKHLTERRSVPSRFNALTRLVGEDAAIVILNELAIRQCTAIGR